MGAVRRGGRGREATGSGQFPAGKFAMSFMNTQALALVACAFNLRYLNVYRHNSTLYLSYLEF